MSSEKKRKSIHLEETKSEVKMSEEAVLDSIQTELDVARLELEKVKVQIEEKKNELKFESRREISEEERQSSKRQIATTNESRAAEALIDQQKAFDNVKITGRFMNRRAPGQPAKLTYIKYVDDPVKWYTFEDGKIYTIPRGFADQINDYYHTPVFTQKEGAMDPNAPTSQISEVDKSNKKYAFVPVNF